MSEHDENSGGEFEAGDFSNQVESFGKNEGEDDDWTVNTIDVDFVEVKAPPSSFAAPPRAADDRDAIRGEEVARPTATDNVDPTIEALLASLPTDKEVSIIVKRKPDHGLSFRMKNAVMQHVDTRIWGGESLEQMYDEIARVHGGGRYWFQIRTGQQGLGRSWEATIADPAQLSEKERLALGEKAKGNEQERREEPSPTFVNQPEGKSAFHELRDRLKETQELKDLLGISDARPEAPYVPVKDQVLLHAMRGANDPELNAAVLKKAFAIGTDEKKSWIDIVFRAPEIIRAAGETIQSAGPYIGPLIGMFTGRGPTPPNMPMPPGAQPPSPFVLPTQPVQPAPTSGFQMPDPEPEAPSPAVVAETLPAAPQADQEPLVLVDW